uniref:Uncharacterized protein n=1 Tax=Nelumbo nucifera TaxID=4432 RepID=A0A822XDP9_NELNU|nr:TPA_asm: hypothetical protein HUJ06_019495 [Nelumbo nucifera]
MYPATLKLSTSFVRECELGIMVATRPVLTLTGRVINNVVSFIVFCFLDLFDVILCIVYKEAIMRIATFLLSEPGESKVVCLRSNKLQLDDVSETPTLLLLGVVFGVGGLEIHFKGAKTAESGRNDERAGPPTPRGSRTGP